MNGPWPFGDIDPNEIGFTDLRGLGQTIEQRERVLRHQGQWPYRRTMTTYSPHYMGVRGGGIGVGNGL